MRDDMIGARVMVQDEGGGTLVAWAPPNAVVVLDSGVPSLVSFTRLVVDCSWPSEANALRQRLDESRSLLTTLKMMEKKHDAFFEEHERACVVLGKKEDETLVEAAQRVVDSEAALRKRLAFTESVVVALRAKIGAT